jgi:hypothetical protein
MWTLLSDPRVATTGEANSVGQEDGLKSSNAEAIRIARIITNGINDSTWNTRLDMQEILNFWLDSNSVRFRFGTVKLDTHQCYGLASLFHNGLNVPQGSWQVLEPCAQTTPPAIQRFCGWNSAHGIFATEPTYVGSVPVKANKRRRKLVEFRVQYADVPPSTTLLDAISHELFVALMMSLAEHHANHLYPEYFGVPEILGYAPCLRLRHPVVRAFCDAFIEAGLGTF